MVVLGERSGDYQSQWACSSGEHQNLYGILWQSILIIVEIFQSWPKWSANHQTDQRCHLQSSSASMAKNPYESVWEEINTRLNISEDVQYALWQGLTCTPCFTSTGHKQKRLESTVWGLTRLLGKLTVPGPWLMQAQEQFTHTLTFILVNAIEVMVPYI